MKYRRNLMPKCIKSDAHAIDYVYGELPASQAADYEQHLTNCNKCTRKVNTYKHVLHLVDEAEVELTPHAIVPNNLEMKLYRRLAEVQTLKSSIRTYLSDFTSKVLFIFREQKAVSICIFTFAVITIALFIGKPFPTTTTFDENQSDAAYTRIEQYRYQDIQRSMEDVIRNRHLRYSDTWDTVSELNRVKDQAQGTNWANIAKQHLKSVNSEL